MAASSSRRTFATMINVIFISMVLILMSVFIFYFNKGESHYQTVALSTAADNFATVVTNAHWEWQSKGSPNRIILVDYNEMGKETNRRPITMGEVGYPRVEPSTEGCAKLWDTILDMPLTLNNFNIKPEFFDGLEQTGKILDTKCRYTITFGPYFEYYVFTGRVTKSE